MGNRVRRLVTLALLGFLCHGTTTFFLGLSKLFSRNQLSGADGQRAMVLRSPEEVILQHVPLWEKLEPGTKVMLLGRPGSGKSTLLNSMIDRFEFRSSLSFGAGKTRTWEAVTMKNDVTFIDTPGLSDPELRKEAANNITAALKEGGKFKILFMLTTLSGRVSPEDVTSMKVILDAVPTISENQFGIIVNRLGTAEYEGLRRSKQNFADFLKPIWAGLNTITVKITLLKEDEALAGSENHVKTFPDLEELVMSVPTIEIEPCTVRDVESRNYQEVLEDFERLSNDNARMEEEIWRKAPRLINAGPDWTSGDGEDSGGAWGGDSDRSSGWNRGEGKDDGSGSRSGWWGWAKWALSALLLLLFGASQSRRRSH